MKYKIKHKKQPLTLDFVTRLSPQECYERLQYIDATIIVTTPSENYVIMRQGRLPLLCRLRGTGNFKVFCSVALRAVQDGARVLGSYSPRTTRRIAFEKWVGRLVVIGVSGLYVLSIIHNPHNPQYALGNAVILLLVGLGARLIFNFRSDWIEEDVQKLLSEIRSRLVA